MADTLDINYNKKVIIKLLYKDLTILMDNISNQWSICNIHKIIYFQTMQSSTI